MTSPGVLDLDDSQGTTLGGPEKELGKLVWLGSLRSSRSGAESPSLPPCPAENGARKMVRASHLWATASGFTTLPWVIAHHVHL